MAKTIERQADKVARWHGGEFSYLCHLIDKRGDDSVGRDPKTVAQYLRMQASNAFRQGHYKLAACIGDAASCINCDARNNHAPDWTRANASLQLAVTD